LITNNEIWSLEYIEAVGGAIGQKRRAYWTRIRRSGCKAFIQKVVAEA